MILVFIRRRSDDLFVDIDLGLPFEKVGKDAGKSRRRKTSDEPTLAQLRIVCQDCFREGFTRADLNILEVREDPLSLIEVAANQVAYDEKPLGRDGVRLDFDAGKRGPNCCRDVVVEELQRTK